MDCWPAVCAGLAEAVVRAAQRAHRGTVYPIANFGPCLRRNVRALALAPSALTLIASVKEVEKGESRKKKEAEDRWSISAWSGYLELIGVKPKANVTCCGLGCYGKRRSALHTCMFHAW